MQTNVTTLQTWMYLFMNEGALGCTHKDKNKNFRALVIQRGDLLFLLVIHYQQGLIYLTYIASLFSYSATAELSVGARSCEKKNMYCIFYKGKRK